MASPTAVSPPTAMAPDARPDWVRGRLEVRDRPLPEVLAELARYHRGMLRYRALDLAGIRVSGVLPLDDPDRALDALAASLPIRVHRYSSWWVVVSPDG